MEILLMDEIRRSPVEVKVVYPITSRVLYRWCRISDLSTVSANSLDFLYLAILRL